MIVLMETVIIYVALVLVGLCLGSFAGASVWRLRARQLKEDKVNGEPVDAKEYKRLSKLTKASLAHDRSQCLYCSYTLRWYDLVPLVSWLSLGGRCRQCHHPIGWFEPLIELGVALFFVGSYIFWPYELTTSIEITRLIIWLVSGVGLAILFAYDAKWFLLPDRISFTVIGFGIVNVVLTLLTTTDIVQALWSTLGAILILSGLYLALYLISKGRWIGLGDVKLGLGLGLLLADWRLAFITLFAANVIGCLVVIPGLISGKLTREAHVPFGPLLIAGTVVAQFFGGYLLSFYLVGML